MLCVSAAAAACVAFLMGMALAAAQPDPRVADLVQAGQIRFGLFASQFTKDAATGVIKSVRVDFARALAARIGIPAVFVEYKAPADAVQCLKAGGCDAIFLPLDDRAASVGDFSPPLIQSEYTMLVPPGSAIARTADADKLGVRIAAVRGHASTLTLNGVVKQATIVLGENEQAALDLLRSGRADVFASTRQSLLKAGKELAGWRVLADHYGANLNRVVVPKGKAGRLAYVSEFVEYAKASGWVQQAIDRDGTFAFQVPPPGDQR